MACVSGNPNKCQCCTAAGIQCTRNPTNGDLCTQHFKTTCKTKATTGAKSPTKAPVRRSVQPFEMVDDAVIGHIASMLDDESLKNFSHTQKKIHAGTKRQLAEREKQSPSYIGIPRFKNPPIYTMNPKTPRNRIIWKAHLDPKMYYDEEFLKTVILGGKMEYKFNLPCKGTDYDDKTSLTTRRCENAGVITMTGPITYGQLFDKIYEFYMQYSPIFSLALSNSDSMFGRPESLRKTGDHQYDLYFEEHIKPYVKPQTKQARQARETRHRQEHQERLARQERQRAERQRVERQRAERQHEAAQQEKAQIVSIFAREKAKADAIPPHPTQQGDQISKEELEMLITEGFESKNKDDVEPVFWSLGYAVDWSKVKSPNKTVFKGKAPTTIMIPKPTEDGLEYASIVLQGPVSLRQLVDAINQYYWANPESYLSLVESIHPVGFKPRGDHKYELDLE